MIKSDSTYDYFFEVDGERRYDFDSTFGPADLYNYKASADEDEVSTYNDERIVKSQIIIANSISICMQPFSSSSSCSSSTTETTNTMPTTWWSQGPVVTWPSKVPEMMMPGGSETVAFDQQLMFKGEYCVSTKINSDQNSNQQNNELQHHKSKHHSKPKTKHVHFNEHPNVVLFALC